MNRRKFISAGLGSAAAFSFAGPQRNACAQQSAHGNRSANIAIIGAGLFGSATARHLSKHVADVVLIGPAEPANTQTHEGVFASHYDASRLVRGIDPDLIWATLAKRSIARYRAIEKASGIDFYHDVGYMMVTPGGLGEDWFNLPAMRDVAVDLGVKIEDLDDADLRSRYPYLRYTPGSSAVMQSRDAGYIDPRKLLAAQQSMATAQGVVLRPDVAVALNAKSGHVEIGLRSGEKIRANRVLVATGAYVNASMLLRERLDVSVRAAMIMETDVAPETRGDYPTTLYAKTDGEEDFWGLLMPPIRYADGRTVIKTMDGYYGPEPLRGAEAMGAWSRSRGHEEHHHVLKRALREVYPSLSVLSTRFSPCLIADTGSRYPYIDMLDERIGVVAGGNGKSAKSSDEIGRLAADMISNGNWAASVPQAVFRARFAA